MIIVRIAGGLGNQMQQYALYRKLLHCGVDKDVRLDISWYTLISKDQIAVANRELLFELPRFRNIPLPICTDIEKSELLRMSFLKKSLSKINPKWSVFFVESKMYHDKIYSLKDKYIEGYFACQKYFDDIMEELQNIFAFPYSEDKQVATMNREIIEEMESVDSVSVHIRRGDYLESDNKALFGNITTEAYYLSAMNYFREIYPRVHFYFFSDDTEYVKNQFKDKKQYTVVDHNNGRNSIFDMQLMSHCHGNICANSTFSFWGARLNRYADKKVIRPLTMRNNQFCDPFVMHEYWPGWILIDNEGKVV